MKVLELPIKFNMARSRAERLYSAATNGGVCNLCRKSTTHDEGCPVGELRELLDYALRVSVNPTGTWRRSNCDRCTRAASCDIYRALLTAGYQIRALIEHRLASRIGDIADDGTLPARCNEFQPREG